MKKSYVFVLPLMLFVLVQNQLFAQTNTFPSSGNVGIGTTNPIHKLSIVGSGSPYTMAAYTMLYLHNAGPDSKVQIGFGSTYNAMAIRYTSDGSTSSDQRLSFVSGGNVEKFVMNNFGNVGIGTTGPVQKLEVWGVNSLPGTSGYAQDGLLRLQPTGSNATFDFGMVTSNAAAWIQPRDRSNYGTNFNLSLNPNGGNVGIGTTTPVNKVQIGSMGTSGYSGNQFAIGDGSNVFALLVTAGRTNFYSNGNYTFVPSGGSGNVGIGTTTPSYKLDVAGTVNATGGMTVGTINSGTALHLTTNVTDVATLSLNGSGENLGVRWFKAGDLAMSLRLVGGTTDALVFSNTSSTYPGTDLVAITAGGNLLVGKTQQTANGSSVYRIDVGGKMRADEIVVNTTGEYPDFVFDAGYKLMPLNELEQNIKKLGHLPNIPSAKEAAENGIPLGEMQTKLLQKIEELTLYVIELKKENEEMRKQFNSNGKK